MGEKQAKQRQPIGKIHCSTTSPLSHIHGLPKSLHGQYRLLAVGSRHPQVHNTVYFRGLASGAEEHQLRLLRQTIDDYIDLPTSSALSSQLIRC